MSNIKTPPLKTSSIKPVVGAGYGWVVWGCAAAGVGIGVAYIRYFDRRLRTGKGSMPEIIRIIE